METQGNFFPKQCENVYYWEQPDQSEAILVKSIDQSQVLNSTGRLIWLLCDGAHERQAILRILKEHFGDIEETSLACDLERFLSDLINKGYLYNLG